ncbi:MAG: hypothetical protein CO118_08960, partial [Flavobacteriales bacterium CG_4_9_14_3_um_filter_32_8]
LQTFNFTGALQTWTVPAGVTSITVDVKGAQGGGAYGGNGGRSQATITVIPGQTLNIYVGGTPTVQLGPGGFNGGGAVAALPCGGPSDGWPGGGASDIRIGGTTLNDRIIVAGGGGGMGWSNGLGGAGGGTIGSDGAASWIVGTNGFGATQVAGGNGGFYSGNGQSAPSGTLGVGGDSGPLNTYCTGGGGGGGYYGGGGGYVSAAGGGSSLVPSGGSTTSNYQVGNGEITISYTAATITTTQTAGLASGSTFPIGVTTNTFSATTIFGTVTCSFTVTVVDAEAPAITCLSNITVNNDAGMCDAVITYAAPVGTDNCAGATTALFSGLGSGATFPIGTTTETYEVTDAAANATSCSFTVTVVDAEAPVITCPSDISSCNPVVNYAAPVGADNCAGATTTMTAGLGDGATFPIGTTTETYEVTDSSGNTTSCSFTVTINALPTVTLATFSPDTICDTDPVVALPVGTPALGTYSGNGVTGANFDPALAGIGTHYVYYNYTDSNTCSSSDSTMIVVVSCVGINENASLTGINVFPNPANNVINISLGATTTTVNFTLSAVDGKVVYQAKNSTDKITAIDISNFSKGIYFLKVTNESDYKVFKVIKQ